MAVLSLDDQPRMCFEEFMLPITIREAISLDDKALLVLSKSGQLFYVEFTTKSENPKQSQDNIWIKVTRVGSFDNIQHFCVKEKQTYIVTLQAILATGIRIEAKIDLSAPFNELSNDPLVLKSSIQDALNQLSVYEEQKKKLEMLHEEYNSSLIATNQILYALQSKSQKNFGDQFHCDIRPVVVNESLEYVIPAVSMLRVRVTTHWDMDWNNWQLHVHMVQQRTLSQETISADIGRQDTGSGMSLSFPLAGLGSGNTWEKMIALDTENLRLPLDVFVKLSVTIPSPDTQQSEGQSTFFVLNIMLDDLHFISPCSEDIRTEISLYNFQKVSAMGQKSTPSSKALGKSSQWPFSRLQTQLNKKDKQRQKIDLSEVTVCFDLISKTVAWDTAYRSTLSYLLQEGRTSDEMKLILDSAERAVFTLARYPQCLVVITIAKDDVHVSLKVQAALLCRLQDHMVTDSHETAECSHSAYDEFGKMQKQLTYSISEAEEKYQKDQDAWGDVRVAVDVVQKLHNNRSIGCICFDDEEEDQIEPMEL
ncbi:hypothetical protein DFQ28_006897 [Apophysomyces sp. BC1034]|nr:hypothetical protein DFQ28_006897 [Apophysomyces sp. BC1034]